MELVGSQRLNGGTNDSDDIHDSEGYVSNSQEQEELNPENDRNTVGSQRFEAGHVNYTGTELDDDATCEDMDGYVSDTREREQNRIENLIDQELHFTTFVGTKLGIEYGDTDVKRLRRMIEAEVKELNALKTHNRFAPLMRN